MGNCVCKVNHSLVDNKVNTDLFIEQLPQEKANETKLFLLDKTKTISVMVKTKKFLKLKNFYLGEQGCTVTTENILDQKQILANSNSNNNSNKGTSCSYPLQKQQQQPFKGNFVHKFKNKKMTVLPNHIGKHNQQISNLLSKSTFYREDLSKLQPCGAELGIGENNANANVNDNDTVVLGDAPKPSCADYDHSNSNNHNNSSKQLAFQDNPTTTMKTKDLTNENDNTPLINFTPDNQENDLVISSSDNNNIQNDNNGDININMALNSIEEEDDDANDNDNTHHQHNNDNAIHEYSNLQITAEEEKNFLKNIRANILFTNFTQEMFTYVLDKAEGIELELNTVVYKEGDEGTRLFLIKTGTVELSTSHNHIPTRIIGVGQCFGELGLIQLNLKRLETAKTLSKVQLLYVDYIHYKDAVKLMRNYQVDQVLNYINSNMWLNSLDIYTKSKIGFMAKQEIYEKNQIVLSPETCDNNTIYLIQIGCLKQIIQTSKDTYDIIYFRPREFFGDVNTILNVKENYPFTIIAIEETICYTISQDILNETIGHNYRDVLLFDLFQHAIAKNAYFKTLFMQRQIEPLYKKFQLKQYEKGEIVFDIDCDKNKKAILTLKGSLQFQEKISKSFHGLIYGDEIINTDTNLPCVIKANSMLTVLEASWFDIKKSLFKIAKTNTTSLGVIKRASLLSRTRMFKYLSEPQLLELSAHCSELRFRKGDHILEKGATVSYFYLITKGRVIVEDNKNISRELNEGSTFGEVSLLMNQRSNIEIEAIEDVNCITLSKDMFIQYLKEQTVNEYVKYKICLEDSNVELEDFYTVSHLGKGKYGSVHLVHNTICLYALKSVHLSLSRKDTYLARYLISEKKILQSIDHPFIVKLVKTFRLGTMCFFLMEYINGRTLEDTSLYRNNIPKIIKSTLFYGASLFLTLDYLHHKMICHRDIKPANIVVDDNGYMKLIDFGAAKSIKDFAYTLVGTPNCMAPEILLGSGYSFPADYWSVGMVLFYIVYGTFPYKNTINIMKLYKEIVSCDITYPDTVNGKIREISQFLQKLLKKDPIGRLCSFRKIQEEPLFDNFPWNDLLTMKLNEEYIPYAKGKYSDKEKENFLMNCSSKYKSLVLPRTNPTFNTIGFGNRSGYGCCLENEDEENEENEEEANDDVYELNSIQYNNRHSYHNSIAQSLKRHATLGNNIYNKYLEEF